jgi:hypothetical protein
LAGEVPDNIHISEHPTQVRRGEVDFRQGVVGIAECPGDIGALGCLVVVLGEAIDANNGVPLAEETIHQCASNKPCRARYHHIHAVKCARS